MAEFMSISGASGAGGADGADEPGMLSAGDIAGTFDDLLARVPLGAADAAVPAFVSLVERMVALLGARTDMSSESDLTPEAEAAVAALLAGPAPSRAAVAAAVADANLAARSADALHLGRLFALAAAAPARLAPSVVEIDAAVIADLLRTPVGAETPCASPTCAAADLPKATGARLRACALFGAEAPSSQICFVCLVKLTERAIIQEEVDNPHYVFADELRPRGTLDAPGVINAYSVLVGPGGVRSDAVYQPSSALQPRVRGNVLLFSRLHYLWMGERVEAQYFFGIASAAPMLL